MDLLFKKFALGAMLLVLGSISAQEIVRSEYWVGDDYAGRTTLNHSSDSIVLDVLDVSDVAAGVHSLHFRALDDEGYWSSVYSQQFLVLAEPNLTRIEYWVNDDYTARVSQSVSGPLFSTDSLQLPEELDAGIHALHFRALDAEGRWSSVYTQEFLQPASPEVTRMRYFLNGDVSTMREIGAPQNSGLITLDQIDLAPLPQDLYTIHFQFLDKQGFWSSVYSEDMNYVGPEEVSTNMFPTLTLVSGDLNFPDTLSGFGAGYDANNEYTLRISSENYLSTSSITSSLDGLIAFDLPLSSDMVNGDYSASIENLVNGVLARRFFTIQNNEPQNLSSLRLIKPNSGEVYEQNETLRLHWIEQLSESDSYPSYGSLRAYSYNLRYRIDGGVWVELLDVIQGLGFLEVEESFFYDFDLTELGTYEFEVIDSFNNQNVAVSGQFSVLTDQAPNAVAEFEWDFSYDRMEDVAITGICADGVSRFYLKVMGTNGGNLSAVSIQLQDENGSESPELLGKIMPASTMDIYSDEANQAAMTSAWSSDVENNEVYFWYVAPDDFSRGFSDEERRVRVVNLAITTEMEGLPQQQMFKSINVYRPPLLLVHGLGGSAQSWNRLTDNLGDYVLGNRRLLFANAININPRAPLQENALAICATQNFENLAHERIGLITFQDNIAYLRNRGIVANQVDYIGHSMGGSVGRMTEDVFPHRFYRTGSAQNHFGKNYGQGFINKFITVATPHNGSLLADIATRYATEMPLPLRRTFTQLYAWDSDSFIFSLMQPDDVTSLFAWTFKASEAVKDLSIDDTEGHNHDWCTMKSHTIAADIIPELQGGSLLNIPVDVMTGLNSSRSTFNQLYLLLSKVPLESPELQMEFDAINEEFISKTDKVLRWIEAVGYTWNLSVNISDSDIVVDAGSQLGAIDRYYMNSSTVLSPNIHCCATNINVLKSPSLGEAIFTQLNAPIDGPAFDDIPSTPNFQPTEIPAFNPNAIHKAERDTEMLSIVHSLDEVDLTVDSIFELAVFIGDTSALYNLQLAFQGNLIELDNNQGLTSHDLQVTPEMLGPQELYIMASSQVTADSILLFYDSLNVNVVTSSPLLEFEVEEPVTYLAIHQEIQPTYRGHFQAYSTPGSNFSPDISANIEDTTLVSFNNFTKSFTALEEGITYAVMEYGGLTDTLHIVIQNSLEVDTTFTTSLPVWQSSSDPSQSLDINPNPSSSQTTFVFNTSDSKPVQLEISDTQGRLVERKRLRLQQPGRQEVIHDVSALQDGVYLIRVIGREESWTGRLVKQE